MPLRFNSRKSYIAYCRSENKKWFEDNRGRYLVRYLRNPVSPSGPYIIPVNGRIPEDKLKKPKGYPTAVMVAWRDGERLMFGWSAVKTEPLDSFSKMIMMQGLEITHRLVEPFVKAMGLHSAISRLRAVHNVDRVPYRVAGPLINFLQEADEELFEKPKRRAAEAAVNA
jgi:hypothetical protein